jgi:hypothetical protein
VHSVEQKNVEKNIENTASAHFLIITASISK